MADQPPEEPPKKITRAELRAWQEAGHKRLLDNIAKAITPISDLLGMFDKELVDAPPGYEPPSHAARRATVEAYCAWKGITRQGFAEQIRTSSKQQRLGYSTFRRWWEDPTEVNAATRQAIEKLHRRRFSDPPKVSSKKPN